MSPALCVAVLHDPVAPEDGPDRQDTYNQARAVAQALERLGFEPRLTPFLPDLAAMRAGLAAMRPDLAVNLVESLAGLDRLAFAAPALLAALGIAHTGSDAAALLATAGKSAVKRRLRMAGLPTPTWLASAPRPGDPEPGPGRYLLKPEFEHGSVGVGDDAVVSAQGAGHLAELLRARQKALGLDCLAEAYLPGREFAVAVLAGPHGPEALPPAEMRFLAAGPEDVRVLTYASKWQEKSAAYANTVRAFPEDEPELLAQLQEAALAVWRVFGLAGYARVDFRLDSPEKGAGRVQIIDVNANPCLAPDAGLAAAAARAGLSFDALVARLVDAALGVCPAARPVREPLPAADGLRWRTRVLPGDPEAVRRLVEATGFFNAEEIVVAGELVQEHLAKGEASGYFFLFAEDAGDGDAKGMDGQGLAGYACYGPVPGTADSFDLYWIAVARERMGQGLGGRLLAGAEADMAGRGAGGIYAETSSREQYRLTRRFYEKHGYAACARLAGFYAAGDDKVIYHKRARAAHTEHT